MSEHKDKKVVKLDDLYWPIYDQKARPYLIRENDLPKNISKYCESTRMCVQAGGNVGYYVKLYAEIFDQVITFEPDDLNFYCMEKNITETNLLDKIDMLDKPETADIQLESFLTSIRNKQVDNSHLDIVERTHLLAFEILRS